MRTAHYFRRTWANAPPTWVQASHRTIRLTAGPPRPSERPVLAPRTKPVNGVHILAFAACRASSAFSAEGVLREFNESRGGKGAPNQIVRTSSCVRGLSEVQLLLHHCDYGFSNNCCD